MLAMNLEVSPYCFVSKALTALSTNMHKDRVWIPVSGLLGFAELLRSRILSARDSLRR